MGRGRLGATAGVTALRRERFARHGLATRPAVAPLAAAALTTAVQAQDVAASHLGLRARGTGFTDATVRHAIEVERSVVRTRRLRDTIHRGLTQA